MGGEDFCSVFGPGLVGSYTILIILFSFFAPISHLSPVSSSSTYYPFAGARASSLLLMVSGLLITVGLEAEMARGAVRSELCSFERL